MYFWLFYLVLLALLALFIFWRLSRQKRTHRRRQRIILEIIRSKGPLHTVDLFRRLRQEDPSCGGHSFRVMMNAFVSGGYVQLIKEEQDDAFQLAYLLTKKGQQHLQYLWHLP